MLRSGPVEAISFQVTEAYKVSHTTEMANIASKRVSGNQSTGAAAYRQMISATHSTGYFRFALINHRVIRRT